MDVEHYQNFQNSELGVKVYVSILIGRKTAIEHHHCPDQNGKHIFLTRLLCGILTIAFSSDSDSHDIFHPALFT